MSSTILSGYRRQPIDPYTLALVYMILTIAFWIVAIGFQNRFFAYLSIPPLLASGFYYLKGYRA